VATPHAFVFDRERKLRYVGRIDDDERGINIKSHDLRNAIDALLAGRDPEVKQTKVFGCSIKWAGKEESVKRFMDKLAAEPVSVEAVDPNGLKALRKNDSGKLRMVNFWATWCGPCITEFPELVTINRMYRQRAFEMITVSANYPEEQKQVLNFLRKHQSSGRNLIFSDTDKYKMVEAFDADWSGALPLTVLIDAGGKIVFRQEGEIDPLELKRAIVAQLKEDRFK
jgi:thiol-disulfide isomerase/thioredoxin